MLLCTSTRILHFLLLLSNGLKPEIALSLSVNQNHSWSPRNSPETARDIASYTLKRELGLVIKGGKVIQVDML